MDWFSASEEVCSQAFLCIWTKAQVGPKLRFSPKLRYFSRNSGSKIGKLRYSETNHLKLSVFKLKNASTERFYVLMAGKKLLMPSMETSKQEFSKLRSIFVKNSGHKTAKLRSDEQKTQVRVSKTQVFGNKVFVFV